MITGGAMEVKTIQDILKFQGEFIQKVQKQMELIGKGKAPSAEELINEKKEFLTRYKERLDVAAKAKEEVIHRYDEEIQYNKNLISRLEKEIKEDKKAIERAAAEAAKAQKERGKGKKEKGKEA
jgi:hypothetical protein